MLDETKLIPFCNDSETRLCHDAVRGVYWVYAPTAGRIFPWAQTPEGAWKNWYIVLANMTPDPKLKSVFLTAAKDIAGTIPMDIVIEAAHPKEVK
jgi:hypothetical protein